MVDMSLLGARPTLYAFLILLGGFVANFLRNFYRRRGIFRSLRKQDLPMPPWSPITGHILTLGNALAKLPQDIHGHWFPDALRRENPNLPPVYYLDLWPVQRQMLIVGSPDACYQITQEHPLPKCESVGQYVHPLVGPKNLLTMEGQEWKYWRGIFNPGFNVGHLMTLVPEIVEDTLTYCDILREHATKGDTFQLEEVTTKLTVDIIGKVVLDVKLHAQRSNSDLVSGFRGLVKWLLVGIELNPFVVYNPVRPIMHRYYARRMDRYLSRVLEERFVIHQGAKQAAKANRSKPVIDLALDTFNAEQKYEKSMNRGLDPTFKAYAMSQMKIFLFAGHDTSSSTICYTYYLLSTHPEANTKICAEHDKVFGPDPTKTASLVKADPHLLSKLPYTTGVIKEVLRLFPPASSVRGGEKGVFININGQQYPTEGFMVWAIHHAIGRDPRYWPHPDSFMPERWLVPEGDPLYPIKGAFRPFEFGPRNCIGQELAMLEIKLIMAMSVRTFDVRADFETWDKLHPKKGPRTAYGERAYQMLQGSAKPVDGFPCRVALKERR